ncbi:hypothetical protein A9G36_02735 [Gilliamella sp. Choc6-1]|uniref:hemagglutinin repeat-containing protein n=1 Tax=Gilliamella sp. Choc6-1 TaxID=3120239 RepID=UPI00080DB659|nr:hemagglutinin repeat-containing protein [Gilliamella apicola]OCG56689.1 hypothetical protein A9G36_02735 [Gilliamella apicola]
MSDIYNANQTREQAKKQTNEKTKALMNIKAGLQAGNAALEGGANLQNGTPQASIGINVSIGNEKTERTVNQEQHTVVSSGISAGNNVSIIATGNGQKESGDINIIGSQVSAGHDVMLKANHDVNIIGQENTIKTETKEKSSSGSVGVGYNFGGEKNGFTISASASQSKSREKDNGTDWTESVVEAGNKLTIITGNDANIVAGQVKGNRVVADIGHDLNIESKQDSDEFHSKSTSTSVGGSFSYGGSSSINASASKTKMDSNWQSVTDQSGIFAGSGGFDIKVGNNTDLKGAVIASEAKDKSQNRLDTGTISFSDIENKAEFEVDSIGMAGSTSHTDGNPKPNGGMPSIYEHDDKTSNITHSAISEGELIIRDTDKQIQDINELNHDTEQAHHKLNPIFDKEKEQTRQEIVTGLKDLGAEIKDLKQAMDKQNNHGNENKMGSDFNKGIDSAIAIVTGMMTGDIAGGLAGASAPWLAEQIKIQAGDNEAARLIAHAILGAAVAELQGNSGLAGGGAGALTGEIAADIIRKQLYGDKSVNQLTEEEKQNISALAQLAAGLATASAGGSISEVSAAVSSSKNAVENNLLSNKRGVEKLDKESKKLYEKIKDIVGYDEVDKLQQQYNDCKTEECKANVYNQYMQKEQEAGQRLVDLYKTGKLSEDEYYQLVTWYSDTMLEGIKQSQIDNSKNHSFGDWDINDASAWDWTASNVINNPYLNEIRSLILLDKWRSEGLSESEIQERFIKNGILDSFGSGPEVNKIIHQVRNGGLSLEDGLKLASAAAFGKFTNDASKGKIPAGKGTNVKISPENQKYVDILSPEAKQHILYGDGPTSGGHMYPGNPGKTTFPKDWSADKIVHEIGDIATSPNTQWYAQSGTGGLYTKAGNPARWAAYEIRDGVRIRVIYEPANGKIITAFPDKAPVPSHYKPIK